MRFGRKSDTEASPPMISGIDYLIRKQEPAFARCQSLPVQFLRYVVVGLAQNAVAFLIYVELTAVGIGHKTAMTLLFVSAVLVTFFINHTWSFRSASNRGPALWKYCTVYIAGYTLNWLGMWILVDRLGYPHQYVQLALIFCIAIFLFYNFRLWVFR
jgi:putative flippase GtrA